MSKRAALLLVLVLTASGLMPIMPARGSLQKPSVPEFSLQIVDDYVQLTIQNQPIVPNGYETADIFYNIRIKNHDSGNWVNTTVPNPSQGIRGYIGESGTSGSTMTSQGFNSIKALLGLSDDAHQIDYQVEAINGYLNTTSAYAPPIGFDPNSTPVIVVDTSWWSDTQTITIPSTSTFSLLNPTIIAFIAVMLLAVAVISVLLYRRHLKS